MPTDVKTTVESVHMDAAKMSLENTVSNGGNGSKELANALSDILRVTLGTDKKFKRGSSYLMGFYENLNEDEKAIFQNVVVDHVTTTLTKGKRAVDGISLPFPKIIELAELAASHARFIETIDGLYSEDAPAEEKPVYKNPLSK